MLTDGEYFKVSDLACHDGTPYPEEFEDRGVVLLRMADKIRRKAGVRCDVISAYRTKAYNERKAGKSEAHQVASGSQHVEGRALDLRAHGFSAAQLYRIVKAMYDNGELPELGGIGLYPESNWIHVDTFIPPDGHLRKWIGA